MKAEEMVQGEAVVPSPGREIEELADRLRPGANRAEVLRRFDELFRTGAAPDPVPDGFLPGRLLGMSIWAPVDGLVARVASVYMPWQGKTLSAASSTGINEFTKNGRIPLKALFPRYSPENEGPEGFQAFPFRTRIGPGALDPEVTVFKIDYDFEANPAFIIRRILDELVQIQPGVYLGKVLMRVGGRFRPIGFFSLRSPLR
jgi:hypothetical protein